LTRVLVERLGRHRRQLYASDHARARSKSAMSPWSRRKAAIDTVEEIAREEPAKAIRTCAIDPMSGLRVFQTRSWSGTYPGKPVRYARSFRRCCAVPAPRRDAKILEITNGMLAGGEVVAADDAKCYRRQPEIQRQAELRVAFLQAFTVDPTQARANEERVAVLKRAASGTRPTRAASSCPRLTR